jgi:hypothetical protein
LVGRYVVLHLVCIDIDPKAIPPKRTYRSARYFSRGEFARLAYCGGAGGPFTIAEIVASIIAAKRLPENLAANLPEKTLTYLRGKLAPGTVKNRHNARCQMATNGPKEQLKFRARPIRR